MLPSIVYHMEALLPNRGSYRLCTLWGVSLGQPYRYKVKGSYVYRRVPSYTVGDWQSVASVAGVVGVAGGMVNNIFTSYLWGKFG